MNSLLRKVTMRFMNNEHITNASPACDLRSLRKFPRRIRKTRQIIFAQPGVDAIFTTIVSDRIIHPIIAVGSFELFSRMRPVCIKATDEFNFSIQIESEFVFGCLYLRVFSIPQGKLAFVILAGPCFSTLIERLCKRSSISLLHLVAPIPVIYPHFFAGTRVLHESVSISMSVNICRRLGYCKNKCRRSVRFMFLYSSII
jgi:hypothetical protein